MEDKRINDGGAAFARPLSSEVFDVGEPKDYPAQEGMSLRDYIAIKAMAAYIVAATTDDDGLPPDEKVAKWSYEIADAMLLHRSK